MIGATRKVLSVAMIALLVTAVRVAAQDPQPATPPDPAPEKEFVALVVSFLFFTLFARLLFDCRWFIRFRLWLGNISELFLVQARLASSISQRFHPSVIKVTTAIEDYTADTFFKGTLGDGLTNALGRFDVAAGCPTQIFLSG